MRPTWGATGWGLVAVMAVVAELGAGQSVLNQGGALGPGQALRETSGCTGETLTLVYQGDGNLVLYRGAGGRVLWHSHTYGTAAGHAVVQGDGNFVIYTAHGAAAWHTHTYRQGTPSYRLVLQRDENVVLQDGTGRGLWESGTRCSVPVPVPVPVPTPPSTGSGYRGCFLDTADRALPVRVWLGSTTVESCRSACAGRGQPYAGLQYGSECWCGTGYARHGARPESECSMPCQGNAGQRCGNAWRSSVWTSAGGAPVPVPVPVPTPGGTQCTRPTCASGASTWANYGNCVGASGCGGLRQLSNFNGDHADFTTSGMSTCYEWFKGQLAGCNTIQLIYHSTTHRQCTSGSCRYFLSTTPHLHLQRKSCGLIKHARDAIPEPPAGQNCDCTKVTDLAYLSC